MITSKHKATPWGEPKKKERKKSTVTRSGLCVKLKEHEGAMKDWHLFYGRE